MPHRNKTAECPDCGERFSPRGLPGHRRFKHGVATGRSSIPAGAAEEIRDTLNGLCAWIEKVDTRLAGLERATSKENQSRQAEVLQHELADVLGEIGRIKGETEDDEDCESTAYKRLGELRLRQASILMRLGGEVTDDESLMGLLLK